MSSAVGEPKLYRLPGAERRRRIERLTGNRVRVFVEPMRDAMGRAYFGTLIGVAANHGGTVTDLLILRDDERGELHAFSTATVGRVTRHVTLGPTS